MATIGPFIGLAIFPVALGAAFIGYGVTGSSQTIATALVITVILAVGLWLVVRSRTAWRQSARVSNELMAAMLVGLIGFMFLIGGLAAVSPIWIVVGAAVLGLAWLIQRGKPSAAS
jgi:hypothetical protein